MHRLVFVALVVLSAARAEALTFTVNSALDGADANAGDGICSTSTGSCTLRAAMGEANALAGADTIQFGIPSAPPHTITVGSSLPAITEALAISGPALSGDAANLVIDGVNAAGGTGFQVTVGTSTGCSISGIGIKRFSTGIAISSGNCAIRKNVVSQNAFGIVVSSSAAGIVIGGTQSTDANIIVTNQVGVLVSDAASGVTIRRNVIGVGTSGTTAQANVIGVQVNAGTGHVINENTISRNTTDGILVNGASAQISDNKIGTDAFGIDPAGNVIGIHLMASGATTVSGNTISANTAAVIVESNSDGASITSNLIGMTSNGTGVGLASLGNQYGIIVQGGASNTNIGGNTITNSTIAAIDIGGSAGTSTTIVSNTIGRDTGFQPAGNAIGIRILSSNAVTVGGTGLGNVILNNTDVGIISQQGAHKLRRNSIFDNGGIGIDVGNAGVSPNGSTTQDFPVLSTGSNYNGSLHVRGSVQGPASSTVDVELFWNVSCDASGYGEGETLIGSATVSTDATGLGSFLISTSTTYPLGTPITATATSTMTSELSACMATTLCAGITVGPGAIADGAVGTLWSQAFTANGTTVGYTFSTTGSLPPGLTMASNGVLSGTPTAGGTYDFRVIAIDNQTGCGSHQDYSVKICPQIAIDPPTIPDGTTQTNYNINFAASGGTPPYTYLFTGGQNIVGLTLDADSGAYTGTPVAFNSFVFTLSAQDANNCMGSRQYTVNVSLCDVSIRPHDVDLPGPKTGTPYDVTLTTVGETSPVTYAITAGALPAGLSLVGDHIVGTPTTLGPASFTIQGTTANGCVGTKAYSVTTTCGTLAITPLSLEEGIEGEPYAQQLYVFGAAEPYLFTVENLPPGLTVSASGRISGTPEQAGEQDVTVTVTDATGCTSMQVYTLTIDAAGAGCCETSRTPRMTTLLLALVVILRLRRRRAP
jgi:large repetitive protein